MEADGLKSAILNFKKANEFEKIQVNPTKSKRAL